MKALRTPLIHFLAARPASITVLVKQLGCKQDELFEVLNKVGKEFRPIPDKWTLNDKAFKELDVWSFDYPNQDDRQLAINCAISAFDRMRISTKERVWDMLLPKTERGKGKILSNLDLHKGPFKQSNTPKIQVQHSSSDAIPNELAGQESDQKDRLAPSGAEPMARSQSQDQIKKKKVSEKEAQSKRLLKNDPKKAIPPPKVKEDHPAVKKGGKKANVPKSSEFVNDSDEEDGLEDASTLQVRSRTPKAHVKHNLPVKTAVSPQSLAANLKTGSTNDKISKPALSSRNPGLTSAGKEANPQPVTPSRSDATSKPKPAVTDHVQGNIAKSRDVKTEKTKAKNEKAAPTPPVKAPDRKPLQSASSSPASRQRIADSNQASTAMKTLSRQRTTSSPHKPSPLGSSPPTNASDLENGVSSASSTTLVPHAHKVNSKPNGFVLPVNGHAYNTSEHSLKRKADNLDSDIHAHGNHPMNGIMNGIKRHKASAASPCTSDSSNSPLATSHALKRAQDFKTYHARYVVLYREVSESSHVSQEKIDNVKRMHQRLVELKEEIRKGLVGT